MTTSGLLADNKKITLLQFSSQVEGPIYDSFLSPGTPALRLGPVVNIARLKIQPGLRGHSPKPDNAP
jgi:hypothetical protein